MSSLIDLPIGFILSFELYILRQPEASSSVENVRLPNFRATCLFQIIVGLDPTPISNPRYDSNKREITSSWFWVCCSRGHVSRRGWNIPAVFCFGNVVSFLRSLSNQSSDLANLVAVIMPGMILVNEQWLFSQWSMKKCFVNSSNTNLNSVFVFAEIIFYTNSSVCKHCE